MIKKILFRADFFTFQDYPFILTTENKTQFLFYDSKVKQYAERHNALFHGAFLEGGLSHASPYLKLNVSRNNIVRKYFDYIFCLDENWNRRYRDEI